jgi:hypothetical protein
MGAKEIEGTVDDCLAVTAERAAIAASVDQLTYAVEVTKPV